MTRRLKHWGWGYEDEQPSVAELREASDAIRAHLGFGASEPEEPAPLPELPAPRLRSPDGLGTSDDYERALHAYGRAYRDIVRAFRGRFDHPPDVVARPRSEEELERVLEWALGAGALVVPFGGSTGQQNNTYHGKGGVPIGSTWRRLLYAWKFRDKNFLFSSGVTSKSQLLYIRNPRDRVQKVAPFLTLDSDPYPAIVDGHIVWIIDGYTTSDGFPYAARTSLSAATNDTLVQAQGAQTPVGQVNYIRNSVKATVDAYDGTVRLYQWGPRDPLLQTWMKAFPGIVRPQSDIPPALLPHLRYPEDLFKVQRALLTKYHISDAHAFYAGTDYWRVPDDPSKSGNVAQPPYYLTLARPGQATPTFQLTTSLLQNNGRNLAAWVAADSDPSSPTYGQMFVLQLPSNALVPGPGLVHNDFRAFPAASTEISLLDQHGSVVDEGNLLTLPIGGAFVYVEPLYVRSTAATSFPTLKRVLADFNGTVAYQPTLAQALDAAFGGTASPTTPTPPPPSSGGGTSTTISQLIASLAAAQADADAALRRGDLAGYAAAEKKVSSLIAQLSAASKKSPSPSPSGSGAPSPSPTGSG